jgi:hypothetical protein
VSLRWVCAGLPSALRLWWWRACSASQTGACAMPGMRTGGGACHPSPPPTASRVSLLKALTNGCTCRLLLGFIQAVCRRRAGGYSPGLLASPTCQLPADCIPSGAEP